MSDAKQAICELCGEPMPPGEEVFNYHGYSGPCPKPPLPAEPNPAHEELAAKLRAASRATEDGKPDGSREGLERCSRMLDTYAPDCFPANDKGQVHFARAMMESTADTIRAFLAANG